MMLSLYEIITFSFRYFIFTPSHLTLNECMCAYVKGYDNKPLINFHNNQTIESQIFCCFCFVSRRNKERAKL
jgi:hypothetical protein